MSVRALLPPVVVALVVGVAALIAAPSRPSAAAAAGPATVAHGSHAALVIQNYAYAPPALTVKVGSTITVTNRDATAHTVTGKTGGLDSGTVAPGRSVSLIVRKPGTYTYFCQFHAFMTGTIKVLP